MIREIFRQGGVNGRGICKVMDMQERLCKIRKLAGGRRARPPCESDGTDPMLRLRLLKLKMPIAERVSFRGFTNLRRLV